MCLGIPGQIVEITDPVEQKAIADVDGVRREVNVGLLMNEVGGISPGEWVLIHVGFAMSKIDEAEAARTLEYLRGMEQAYADELRAIADSTID